MLFSRMFRINRKNEICLDREEFLRHCEIYSEMFKSINEKLTKMEKDITCIRERFQRNKDFRMKSGWPKGKKRGPRVSKELKDAITLNNKLIFENIDVPKGIPK